MPVNQVILLVAVTIPACSGSPIFPIHLPLGLTLLYCLTIKKLHSTFSSSPVSFERAAYLIIGNFFIAARIYLLTVYDAVRLFQVEFQ